MICSVLVARADFWTGDATSHYAAFDKSERIRYDASTRGTPRLQGVAMKN
jgi:hypothetical protein